MVDNLENRKLFLVVSGQESNRRRFSELIDIHISKPVIFTAQDGSEALMKLENAPPHVLLIEPSLNKTTGWQVIEHLLEDRKYKDTAVIILSPIPDQERFTDEVVIGRIQYIDSNAESDLIKGFAKALNYVSHGEVSEFYLRFLAQNETLIREGDSAHFVYLVKRGRLRAYIVRDEKEIEIGTIQDGEFVGEMAYINNDTRSANVIALSDCELIEIPINHLDHLLFQKPSWSKSLMITLSKRVKRVNEMLGKSQ